MVPKRRCVRISHYKAEFLARVYLLQMLRQEVRNTDTFAQISWATDTNLGLRDALNVDLP